MNEWETARTADRETEGGMQADTEREKKTMEGRGEDKMGREKRMPQNEFPVFELPPCPALPHFQPPMACSFKDNFCHSCWQLPPTSCSPTAEN